ncbi:uncharacterized protein LOC115442433 [Manduca sexta]|uniref:uncharacterized protein LOC115442433 n=1 Tax=Manduca sexta TaxID=7130 RepID=UPI00188FDDF4|nr:uncharacterized protein LOC115442433 [Manduca sexta]XP_030023322.2 uncharacterized protein LOC115442433 [Manduca sexta]XP_037303526.1 uncharacterized protein LOC115442433 [Manduca sexta]
MALNREKAAQQAKNNRLIIAVWENKEVKQKIENVKKILLSGADVNAASANLKHNALQIAVKKAEIDVIKLLLEHGADVTRTKGLDKNALDIAQTLQGDIGQEITTLLEEHAKKIQLATPGEPESDSEDNKPVQPVDALGSKYFLMQDKNTGVRGHLYETKLLCLSLLRAANDEDIESYYLASNMAGIGVFDDICFKYNVKGREKSIRLFLQAKHRDLPKKGRLTLEDVLKPDSELGLANCFDSYLQIKKKFVPASGHPIFGESYHNVELNFIVYTSGEESFNRKLIGRNERSPKIHKLIYTGGKKSIFQFDYNDDYIYCITRDVQRMRIKLLAVNFIEFILGEKDKYKHMLEDELIRKYHCVLEQTAVRLCKVEKNHIEAKFRPELFRNTDPFTVLLKEELCKVIIEKNCVKPTKTKEGIVNEFKRLPREPSSSALSPFIGTVINYDVKNNKLKVLENVAKRGLKSNDIKQLNEHLKQIHANPTVIAEAITKAGENKLLTTEFKLPPSFGNIDITMKDSRITYLVSVFKDLFQINRDKGEIEINETDIGKNLSSSTTLTEGFIAHNGGIASAVGNLLLYDKNKNVLKFNTARPLFEKAYKLLVELEKVIPEGKKLDDYVIKVNTYNFPRARFSNDEYDTTQAKCFLNRLWFYCNQGKEDEVEKSVKTEIDKFYNEHRFQTSFRFRTHIDSIFSKFHSELQKWWMVSAENSMASYLTSDSNIFRIAQEGVDSPLLTLHHEMYLGAVKKLGIEFTSEAVKKLRLDDCAEKIINIKTDNDILTAIKIHQHYKNQNNYTFMDLYYMLGLPAEDRNVILGELKLTSMEILILMCGRPRIETSDIGDFSLILNMFKGNKIIIVTTNVKDSDVKIRIPDNHSTINDDMTNLIHFEENSMKKIAEEITVTFQDEEICLESLLDENILKKINAKILSKVMDDERIEIGKPLMNKQYEKIKDIYMPRRLIKNARDDYPVNNLDDVEDKVVLIISKHGTGKSTLLTHLALENKKVNPTKWIIRINLAEFQDDFYAWQTSRININKINAVKLLCVKSLKHVNNKTYFQLVERGGEITLDTYSANILDGAILLELELFLHYYNNRKMIFLFYGFDYVCPPFGVEAIKLLKNIKSDDIPMWIACHSVGLPMTLLEAEFGTSYQLQPIDETGQMGFFYKFWKTNLQLEKINTELFSNISGLFELMSGKHNLSDVGEQKRMFMPWVSMPLHILYLLAIDFFQTEFSTLSFADIKKKLKQHLDIDLNKGSKIGSYMDQTPEEEQAAELAGTPLHMYVVANYFECKIKGRLQIEPNVPELKKKCDFWQDALHLYEKFLKHNMDKVLLQTHDIEIDEDEEVEKRREFFERHKKLALLAICKEEDLCKLLPADEIDELKGTMARIQSGEEKSALVDCVLDNVPRFFHLMYAEYCGVEFLTDIIKCAKLDSTDGARFSLIWDFIVNIFLYTCPVSVRSAFDYKLSNDPQLAEITTSDKFKNVMFELLLKQNGDARAGSSKGQNPLHMAVDSGMNNFVKVLLMSIETNLTQNNVQQFLKVMKTLDIFCLLLNLAGEKAPNNISKFFTDMNLDRVVDVIKSEHTVELPLSLMSFFVKPSVVDSTRAALTRTRQHLVDKAAERFGLTHDNIELFRRLAETFKRFDDDQ